MRVTLDFETRSACDLKKCGAWVYSEHPTTEPICLWFATGEGRTFLWRPTDPEPPWLRSAIERGAIFEAHNVLFEKGMWKNVMVDRYGWPAIPEEQWFDTMASCARRAIPLDLGDASTVLNLPVVKDYEGQQALMKICKPTGKKKTFNEDPELYARVIDYGKADVLSQQALGRRLGTLEPSEMAIWRLNQRMNARGISLDLRFANDCQAVVDAAMPKLDGAFQKLVGCRAGQRDKVLQWAQQFGVPIPNLKKETVEDLLKKDLPEPLYKALRLRGAITSTSIAKLASMRRVTSGDGRARGLIQYHGATTGRDAGRLLQPQNFPRGTVEFGKDEDGNDVHSWDVLVPAIQTRDAEYVSMLLPADERDPELADLCAPIEAVSSALRFCLVAGPGKMLCSGDLSTIEVRVVLAIAGQRDKLDLIAKKEDPYCNMASTIHGRPIDKKKDPAERQDGKRAVLGLGFQMGADKFQKKDFKDRPIEFVQKVVDLYRKEWAPEVPKLWYGLQEASTKAVWDRRPQEFNGIVYELEDEWLTCRLHSGRKLWYFRPRKVRKEMPWSTEEKPDIRPGWTYLAKKMGRLATIYAYGGLLTENVVQATARDILYERALVADAEGYPLVLTVHDENVTEVDEGRTFESGLQQIMEDAPAWARALGIPLAAEGWTDRRYHK